MPPDASQAGSRSRRGERFIGAPPLFPLEQEACLELPLGYVPAATPPSSVAVVLHAYHLDLLPEIKAYLGHIPFPADVFISTDTDAKRAAVSACFAGWPGGSLAIEVTPNRGRDVAPKLVGFAAVHDRYEYVLHMHTKQSLHDERLAGWRGYLFDTLLGSPEVVRGIFAAFAQAPGLGLLAPQHIDELRPWVRWAENHAQAQALAARMGFPLPFEAPLDFPSGSMFWARTAALRPLLDLHLGFDDFPEELGQTDGTLAHAIERLYFLVCEQAGFGWMKVTAKGQLHDEGGVVAVTSDEDLARFLRRSQVRLASLRDTMGPRKEAWVITSPPPKPRRALHVLWRHALGEALAIPPGLRTVIVLRGQAAGAAALVQDAGSALRGLPSGGTGHVIADSRLSRNGALSAGFATGADLVLLLDRPGVLHPGSVAALLAMSQAHQGGALIEAACLPELRSKPVDPHDLTVAWAGGPAIALTRTAFETTGGFDDRLAGQAAELDLSWRARALGLPVLRCPRSLFYPLQAAEEEWLPATGAALAASGQVDAVLRVYDVAELPCVRSCVLTLLGQMRPAPAGVFAGSLHIHLMTQRFTVRETQAVRSGLADLLRLDERVGLTLHNWDYRDPFDLRVPLLNMALEVTSGRYVTFLDSSDLLCPGALARLLGRIATTGAAAALGGIRSQPVRWWGDVFLPVDGACQAGDASATFVVLDRERLPHALCFQVAPPGQEIAGFIGRLRGSCAVEEPPVAEILCVRQVYQGSS